MAEMMELLRVKADTSPKELAGAIAGTVRKNGKAEMQAIGAGAVNQAVKAVAIARGMLIVNGIDLAMQPAFTDVSIEGEQKTAVRFSVIQA